MAEINSPEITEGNHLPHAGPVVLGEPSWGVAHMFPAQGGWTEEEYLDLDLRCGFELHDGVLTCLPMPTHFHQKIVEYLFEALKAYVNRNRLGYVYFAPFAVRLAPQRMRQPNVTFVRKQRITDVHKTVEGADLLMEVVSPGDLNHERDWKVKRDAYAQAGVEEYWLVDPQQRKICVLALVDGSYELFCEATPGQQLQSRMFADFSLDVRAALEAGLLADDCS